MEREISTKILCNNPFLDTILGNFAAKSDEVFCHVIGNKTTRSVRWSDLEASCRAAGALYQRTGLCAGDVILIFVRHGPELYGAFFGAMLNGFVPSFMPPTSPKQNPHVYWSSHAELLRHIRPAAIVADGVTFDEMASAGLDLAGIRTLRPDEFAEGAPEFKPPPPDAIALLQHSSGTTGLKKGVALTYTAITAQVESYARTIKLTQQDVIVSWLPLYHDMGLMACLIMPTFAAIKIIHIDPFHWLARPAILFSAITEYGGTLVWLPNFAYEHLASVLAKQASQFNLAGVRAFIDCSEPCKPRSFDRFVATFEVSGVRPLQLQCCYAMAENVFAVTQTELDAPPRRLRVDPQRLQIGDYAVDTQGSLEVLDVGATIPGCTVRVFDDSRRELPPGHVGEIGISGDFLFSGYYKDPVRTADCMQEGIYFSRDLGFVYDGRLYVLGRKDDLIIINGRNLYAHEIEAAMSGVMGVKPGRGVATSLFDERLGSSALILIAERDRRVERPDKDIECEIIDLVGSIFDIRPRAVRLVEEGWLIKTTSGKISRKENLARHLAEQTELGGSSA